MGEGDLTAEVEGDIEPVDKVLVIKKIRVAYRLRAAGGDREVIERVHGFHAGFCPVAKTLAGSVEISTRLELVSTE